MLVPMPPARFLSFATLTLCGSLAFAQAAPVPAAPAAPPATQGAPIERQPPSEQMGPGMRPGMMRPGMRPGGPASTMHPGMRPGMMQGRGKGATSFRGAAMMHGRGNFRGGPGGGHFGGPGEGMGGGMHMGPGGMWWKNPNVVTRLALTPDQTKKMDGIFQQSRLQLIDLKANAEKQEVMLEPLLSATPFDSAKALLQIDKVADARADLEKANAKMLLGIRGVLTPDQWTKLNTHGGPDAQSISGPGGPGQPGAQGGGPGRGRGMRGGGGPPPAGANLVEPMDVP